MFALTKVLLAFNSVNYLYKLEAPMTINELSVISSVDIMRLTVVAVRSGILPGDRRTIRAWQRNVKARGNQSIFQ